MVQRPFGQNRAFVQDDDLAIQAADEIHVVFDHYDGTGPGDLD